MLRQPVVSDTTLNIHGAVTWNMLQNSKYLHSQETYSKTQILEELYIQC